MPGCIGGPLQNVWRWWSFAIFHSKQDTHYFLKYSIASQAETRLLTQVKSEQKSSATELPFPVCRLMTTHISTAPAKHKFCCHCPVPISPTNEADGGSLLPGSFGKLAVGGLEPLGLHTMPITT